jgi:hypothetical protein
MENKTFYIAKQKIKIILSHHKQCDKKNIFLFSSPRSGSTWLTEIIATQPGFKMVKEPFNIRRDEVRENSGLHTWEEVISTLSEDKIKNYIQYFTEGNDKDWRYRRLHPLNDLWRFRTNRIIFKILFAGEDKINWFKDTFNGEIIFLLRHPIPVSLSREELPRLSSFINTSYSENFSYEEITFAKKLFQNGTKFQKSVLDWCFQNVLPLRHANNNWIVVSYEQMVIQPEIVIKNLVEKFEFPKPEEMFKRLSKASASTGKSDTESQDILRDPTKILESKQWLVDKWKKRVTPEQIEQTEEILNAFGIDFYQSNESLPKNKYLLS